MRPSEDDSLRADGGEALEDEFPFETTASREMTQREVYELYYNDYVVAPASIIWSDLRARIGLVILVGYLLLGTLGPYLLKFPRTSDGDPYMAPLASTEFLLGTDGLGQGILAQIAHATPPMFKLIAAGALFSVVLGTGIGTVAGFKSGPIDRALMSVTDIILMIPGLPLVIILATLVDPRSPIVVGLILGIDNWPGLARTVRSQVLAIREDNVVEASRTMGLSTKHIIGIDILPDIMPYVLINLMNSARRIIFESVGLYFLGILPFTVLNWGIILNNAYTSGGAFYTPAAVWWFLFPLVTIVLFSVGLTLLAQGTDRLFNPRIRARHAGEDQEGEPIAEQM